LFVIDRDRFTCGGGVAPLDMMLSMVRDHLGPDIAGQITDVFSLDRIRPENHPQHVHLRAKVGLTHENLIEAAALMAANIEEPLPMDEVARLVGVSRRQIERLFKRYVGVAPTKYYLDLRLNKARELLQQTSMSIMEISIACGFVSNPHFSHCYRKLFGHAPSVERLEQQFGKSWASSPAGLAFAPANLVQFSSQTYQHANDKLPWARFESKHPPLYQWQQSFWLRQTQPQTERLGA
jgi:transcriptional regulator GlxA family with amidase domain